MPRQTALQTNLHTEPNPPNQPLRENKKKHIPPGNHELPVVGSTEKIEGGQLEIVKVFFPDGFEDFVFSLFNDQWNTLLFGK